MIDTLGSALVASTPASARLPIFDHLVCLNFTKPWCFSPTPSQATQFLIKPHQRHIICSDGLSTQDEFSDLYPAPLGFKCYFRCFYEFHSKLNALYLDSRIRKNFLSFVSACCNVTVRNNQKSRKWVLSSRNASWCEFFSRKGAKSLRTSTLSLLPSQRESGRSERWVLSS